MGFFANIGAEPIRVELSDLSVRRSLVIENGYDTVYRIKGKRGEYVFRIQPTYTCENLSDNGYPCPDCVFNNRGKCRVRDIDDFEDALMVDACSRASTYYFKQA